MAALVAFVYIVCTIVYLAIGDAERTWGGFNHITLLLMIAGMIYFPKPLSALQKDFVDFALGLTLARALYTVICIYARGTIVYEATNYFTITVIGFFIIFLIYSAFTHKKL